VTVVSPFSLAHLKAFAERFAASQLDEYVERLSREDFTVHPKEINDALWGTVGLRPAEVVLLDSPLLQRLRYVRQLGVVHWVYPGAMHTRFEHSLGVLHQVHHIITALNNVAQTIPGHSGVLVDKNCERLLRLCALLHDVGHAAFSHVSEMAVATLPQFMSLFTDFSAEARVESRQFAEIVAYYVARSPSMRRLIELFADRYELGIEFSSERAKNLDDIVERLSGAIIGKKIDDRLPLLHELISGPFDADKLDYFVRDAKLAGTPTLLDISRLVQKLTVRGFAPEELPPDIARHVTRQDKHFLFGVKWSGVAVLDELHLARVLLYAKIYRHPKVAAIEQMLKSVIFSIASVAEPSAVLDFLYQHPDDALLWMTSSSILTALGLTTIEKLSPEQRTHLDAAAQILSCVRERRLWVRAFQINTRYAADPLLLEQKQKLVEFIETVEHPTQRVDFMRSLLDEVKTIFDRLNPTAQVDRASLDSKVMLLTVGTTPGGTQIERAYLLPRTGKPVPFREFDVNRNAWAESYMSALGKGFIFASPELADFVYLAVEKILRLEYQVRLPDSAMDAAKRDHGKLETIKRRLLQNGYYRNTPVDIRPIPERLQRADVAGIVERFDLLRKSYSAPVVETNSPPIAPNELTEMWLRQFDDENHIECALRILEGFKILTRDDTVTALKTFIEQNLDFKGATVVPLGNMKDSGAVHTYFSADLVGTYVGQCVGLDEVRNLSPGAPLIFIDDFIGSGGQAQDMLGAWLGLEALRKDLGENREMFDDGLQAHLKSCRIAFVFVAAWDEGIKTLKKALKDVQLDAEVYRYIGESEIPFLEMVICEVGQARIDSFLTRCREIGKDLLTSEMGSERKPVDPSKLDQRALGYGNRAMLLATPFNVPTQSLTALWATGKTGGVQWQPLLNRRKKH